MPLDFLKRRGTDGPPVVLPDGVVADEHSLRLQYTARTSEGVRFAPGTDAPAVLRDLLSGFAQSPVEIVEPLPVESHEARPVIQRADEAMLWLRAHGQRSPVTRHALVVLETVDAIDLAFDTVVLALLDGTTDTAGYPEFSALVGGYVSHWDEATGEMVARGVVGWGGRGARGDTARSAATVLSSLHRELAASEHALGGAAHGAAPAAGAGGGLTCPHCGFRSASDRTFYCAKCGMRMVRS